MTILILRLGYGFRGAYDLGVLWKQNGFLTSIGNKIKNIPMFRNYWILLPATLTIINILGHSKFDSLEAKGNHLALISVRMLPLKEPATAKSISWSKELFPQMITF